MLSIPHAPWPVATAASLVALTAAVLAMPVDISARLAILAFGAAAICWAIAPLGPGIVAVGAVVFLVMSGAAPQATLAGALHSDIIWLMIGAFVLGEAIVTTGLATRLTRSIASRAQRVDHLFWLVSAALLLLTFVIPSTSGRAAIALPLHRSLAEAMDSRAASRALALLIPIVILVTTIAALTGAGSHLIANDLLAQSAGRPISALAWMIHGLPFAVIAGALSCWMVLKVFLTTHQRTASIAVPPGHHQSWSRGERTVATIAAVMICLWLTEAWHGLPAAAVAMLGALALISPAGALNWRAGLRAMSWDLVLVIVAALILGRALIDTGAANWLSSQAFAAMGFSSSMTSLIIIAGIAGITLASHLVMTSHTTRTVVLVPPLIVLAESLDVDPTAVVFIGTAGMNYCLTLPMSSKALLVFQGPPNGAGPADLLRISALLGPLHLILIVVFYFGYWRWVGLAL